MQCPEKIHPITTTYKDCLVQQATNIRAFSVNPGNFLEISSRIRFSRFVPLPKVASYLFKGSRIFINNGLPRLSLTKLITASPRIYQPSSPKTLFYIPHACTYVAHPDPPCPLTTWVVVKTKLKTGVC